MLCRYFFILEWGEVFCRESWGVLEVCAGLRLARTLLAGARQRLLTQPSSVKTLAPARESKRTQNVLGLE